MAAEIIRLLHSPDFWTGVGAGVFLAILMFGLLLVWALADIEGSIHL